MSITRRKFCYLVILNEKFLTQLASDLLLQIEQVLRLIGITDVTDCNAQKSALLYPLQAVNHLYVVKTLI
ncbi:hypothetical protein CTT31_07905 [Pseudoalteromonas maricaloris]|nr:hypothetical protein CTT31_07905 [Pseudoalteromonas flavipulchra]